MGVSDVGVLLDEHHAMVQAIVSAALDEPLAPDDLVHLLDDLDDSVELLREAISRVVSETVEQVSPRQPADTAGQYEAHIDGVRTAVDVAVPHGATVAVISRGDERLTNLANHRGRHFPGRDDGHWIGYHPQYGTEAVGFLREAQAMGTSHLVIPAPSLWWLSFYAELRTVLHRDASLVHASEHCLIYRLAAQPMLDMSATTRQQPHEVAADLEPLRQLATLLLPAGAHILVAPDATGSIPAFPGFRVSPFPREAQYTSIVSKDDAFAELHRSRQREGAQFLVLPHGSPLMEREWTQVRTEIRARFPEVAERAAVGVIFDLSARQPHTTHRRSPRHQGA